MSKTHTHPLALLESLTHKGFRITKARKALLSIFESHHTPLSADEINTLLLAINISINKSTLYRELDFFITQGVIKSIQMQEDMRRYERTDMHHHHHLVCIQCKNIQDIEVDNCLTELIIQAKKDYSFQTTDHSLDLYGICSQCQPGQSTKTTP